MARKLISVMDLPASTSRIFASRFLSSAKDVLCKTELELMELLDISLPELSMALDRIHKCVCPPHRSVLSLREERNAKGIGCGHLATNLQALDDALLGGIPFGLVTEVVGAAGVGKTQVSYAVCRSCYANLQSVLIILSAAMPIQSGGLAGSVIYIDTERKFTSGRMMEIARTRYPSTFRKSDMMQQLAERVLVFHPSSMSDLMKSLQGLEVPMIERSVRLVIIDSVAALLQSEYGSNLLVQRQEILGQAASLLKFLAESFRIPIVVTNQLRNKVASLADIPDSHEHLGTQHEVVDEGLTAALGTKWAHAVNIRLLLEFSVSGPSNIKIIKSPMSAFAAFPYSVTSKGLELKMETDSTMT